MIRPCFADLHIHIGRTDKGEPVKISASRDLTFYNIAHEASERKGIELIGIIDCHSPKVQEDIIRLLDSGEMSEVEGGGIHYRRTTIILGCEIEIRDAGFGPAHVLAYFPDLATISQFSQWMSRYMKNVNLSSQRIYVPARELQQEVVDRGGLFIPAHIFTPHKSLYGSCSTRLAHVIDPEYVAAVELGLSADTSMALHISELERYSFLSNSDAHSLGRIGREYNRIAVKAPSFEEFALALRGQEGREVEANYGLNPRLGKYHRTYCSSCASVLDEAELSTDRCAYCGSPKIVRGVMDRIQHIADREAPIGLEDRPPYRYQVPLDFLPGIGPRMLERLLDRFDTEMNVLHKAPIEHIEEVAGREIARMIEASRTGTIGINAGGGGHYGKIDRNKL